MVCLGYDFIVIKVWFHGMVGMISFLELIHSKDLSWPRKSGVKWPRPITYLSNCFDIDWAIVNSDEGIVVQEGIL